MKRLPLVEEMFAAAWDDRKTETRRIMQPGQPCRYRPGDIVGAGEPHRLYVSERTTHGLVGSRWVGRVDRELACLYGDNTVNKIVPMGRGWHRAYEDMPTVGLSRDGGATFERMPRNRSGRFLPDPFVRLRFRVVGVRPERLQTITPAGARAEGSPELSGHPTFYAYGAEAYVIWFRDLWDRLHGKVAGERWIDNPWVWVVQFCRCAEEA